MFYDKTKQFEVDWHFTRQKIKDGTIKVNFISVVDQSTNILIQALG
jgi:hypothetical protein